jgi:3-deoxy-D-manno-octulosonic-acid transferase
MLYLLFLLLAIAAISLAIRNVCSQKEIRRLKERYRRLTFASPKVADEAVRLQIIRLKNMTPGHSERWYLQRLIRELERERLRHLQ